MYFICIQIVELRYVFLYALYACIMIYYARRRRLVLKTCFGGCSFGIERNGATQRDAGSTGRYGSGVMMCSLPVRILFLSRGGGVCIHTQYAQSMDEIIYRDYISGVYIEFSSVC